ncbi:tRNA pseudouridine(13) synthase TruD [Alcanivorax sp. JB21]|uniref:tRNA pseudouridine(13) synthase TruD n=1 Tax=Alcanivorax limicola TaxID=2874102 RepID=UPI001CBE7ED3|nr:tRNA pseudouridine(13) synthase TruD [Alcanivorax limicola]MBZ2188380.1 tRNA pseudouridine(13) synthase TruD [Alcanivorax limicola]
MSDQPASELPRAHGGAPATGRLRSSPEDFRVFEEMGVEPDGTGEHLWLKIRKRERNTTDVALDLARLAKLPLRAVGFSGLKDRVAVTEQWFSLHLPGKPDPAFTEALQDSPTDQDGVTLSDSVSIGDGVPIGDGLTLLAARRHSRKLNRGTHRGNRFSLVIRDIGGDLAALEARLAAVAREGVPNYFGEQRFGRHGDNFSRARDWLLGTGDAPRKQALRSMWLSAARSELFNQVLARRVQEDCWQRVLPGDILQPDGRRGLFLADDEPEAQARAAAGEVHPTAPMPGAGGMASSGACAALETAVLAPHGALIDALAAAGVDAARRATRLPVAAMTWQLSQQAQDSAPYLVLDMTLPAGAFATTVLAEVVDTRAQVSP